MRKLAAIILTLVLFVTISGCVSEGTTDDVTIESIEIVQSSIPEGEVLVDQFDLSSIIVRIKYSNDNDVDLLVSTAMISGESLASLLTPGFKTIEVTYENKTASFTIHLIEEKTIEKGNSVNIMALNDTHGAFHPDTEYPGLNQVSQVIKERTLSNGEYVKVVNGDIFQGSYVSNIHFGKPLVDALNAMKFDAFVIGNHEFDWGLEKIAEFKDGDPSNGEADFEFLAANIVTKNNSKTLDWTKDYVVVNNNGYRVGIIGVIQEGLETSIAADKVQDYRFLDPVPIVREVAKKLRADELVDVVLVSIHGYNEITNSKLAALTGESRVDGIIAGHTHQKISEYITRVDNFRMPVIQSQTKNISMGELVYTFNEGTLAQAKIAHFYPGDYAIDQGLNDVMDSYEETILAGERIVTYTPEFLSRNRLGTEMTKAMKEKYNADVAIINTAGVRDDIVSGNIAVKQIFDVFPFDNYIVTTQMSGSRLKSLYSESGSYLHFNPGFSAYSLDNNKIYDVVTIDYVFTSPYYQYPFGQSIGTTQELTMRDVFLAYLEEWN